MNQEIKEAKLKNKLAKQFAKKILKKQIQNKTKYNLKNISQ